MKNLRCIAAKWFRSLPLTSFRYALAYDHEARRRLERLSRELVGMPAFSAGEC